MNLENLHKEKNVTYSLEVFPPKKTSSIDTVYNTLSGLKNLPVDYISVTYGAGGSETERGKTWEIASLIKREYGIEPVAHLTCIDSTKEKMADILDKLKASDVRNILALRGDIVDGVSAPREFAYASDLTAFIKRYDPDFNVMGACYPEGHFESKSIDEDIENLKRKIDAGATSLITQLFFNNNHFYTFMEKLAKAGIKTPVTAGIMPIINKNQIEKTVSMCGASLPVAFSKMISKYSENPTALKDAGIAYATEQIVDLLASDVSGIHLYTMNNVEIATTITNSVKNIINACNGG